MKKAYEAQITLPTVMVIDKRYSDDDNELNKLAFKSLHEYMKNDFLRDRLRSFCDISLYEIEDQRDMEDKARQMYEHTFVELSDDGKSFNIVNTRDEKVKDLNQYLEKYNTYSVIRKKLEERGWDLDESFEDDLAEAMDERG